MATDLTIYEGEDKTYSVVLKDSSGTPIDITGYEFLFTVKRSIDDSDDDAIIKKVITTHSNPTAGATEITIDSADSDNLSGKYVYDYQMIDADTKRLALLQKASFRITQRVGDSFA